jgi:hypothetical protein
MDKSQEDLQFTKHHKIPAFARMTTINQKSLTLNSQSTINQKPPSSSNQPTTNNQQPLRLYKFTM